MPDEILENILQFTPTVRSAFLSSVSSSLPLQYSPCVWHWGFRRLMPMSALFANSNFPRKQLSPIWKMINLVPGTSSLHPKVPWLRLVTCLLDFSRFFMDVIEGRGWKVKFCLQWAHLLNPVGRGICNPPAVDRQNSERWHWHIRCWGSMLSMLG